jgi:hypothetical protein
MRKFMDLFKFDPTKAFFVGVEREAFIINRNGIITPQAKIVLSHAGYGEYGPWEQLLEWHKDERFGYELSACQIESRIGPCQVTELRDSLEHVEECLKIYLYRASYDRDMSGRTIHHDLGLLYTEVGPENMPLDVYPDPSGRYQEIVKTMPRHILLAACRVIGTHIHIGMPDHETALNVYNHVIKKCDWLCARGNGSFGERLDIYRVVAPDCDPQPYADWTDFYRVALAKGFDQDPRKCWTLIRISKHGTIEFRMFGATASLERIVSWARLCHTICEEALH